MAERLALAAVVLALVLALFVRVRLADAPFERDEGEYAYAGQLVLDGVPPYAQAYNMKFPGVYYAYAASFALFGESPRGAHLGLAAVNAATALFVLLLGRRLLGPLGGAAAACAFLLLSLDRFVMGIFAHATHFVALPVTAALWLIARAPVGTRSALGAGVLLGLAVLMKQHAVVYLPFAAALVAWEMLSAGAGRNAAVLRVAALAAGAVLPFALLVAVLAAQDVLGAFWFWTFRYASEYVSQVGLAGGGERFARALGIITTVDRPLWIAAALGFAALWLPGWPREVRVALSGLLVASLLAVVPGFYFREHYFIVLLPAVALCAGVGAVSLERVLARVVPAAPARAAVALAGVGLAASYLVVERSYLFRWTPREVVRSRYGPNPFPEAPEIARYIRERTAHGDRIMVFGSEPEIYFLAERRSATGYVYMYSLLERQALTREMQDQMIREVTGARPAYVVYVSISTSWQPHPDVDRRVLDWSRRYTAACYDLVGVADIHSRDETTWVWGESARDYRPRSKSLVQVYARKSDAPCTAS